MEIIRKTTTYNGTELLKAPSFPGYKIMVEDMFEQMLILESGRENVKKRFESLVDSILLTILKENKEAKLLRIGMKSIDIIIPSKDYFYINLVPSFKNLLQTIYSKRLSKARKKDLIFTLQLKNKDYSYITKEQIFVD